MRRECERQPLHPCQSRTKAARPQQRDRHIASLRLELLSLPAPVAPAPGMHEVRRAAPGSRHRSAPSPFVAPASFAGRRPEHVPAPDRFAPDTVPPASQIVPPPPTVHGLAASLRHCPRESSWSLLPHAQSGPALLSKPIQKSSDAPPASSACTPLLHVLRQVYRPCNCGARRLTGSHPHKIKY